MRFALSSLTLAVFSSLSFSGTAFADNTLPDGGHSVEHITVRGDFHRGSVQKVAGSVAVVSEDDINRTSSSHLDELLNQFANVNYAAGASRGRFIQIRGIGERSEYLDTLNPSVGILVDGIDYSGLGFTSLTDISQLEVFRGPEATRFGANALAGMVNVSTLTPTAQTEGKVIASVANYNSYQLAGRVSGALSDNVVAAISAEQQLSDGFVDNLYLQRDDTADIDEQTVRFKLLYSGIDQLTLGVIAHYLYQDNGYDAFSLDRNRTTLSDEPGADKQRTKALALTSRYEGLSFADIEAQLSWLDSRTDYGFDEDWSYVGLHPDEYSSTDRYLRDREQLTFDYKFVSKAENTGADWVVGFYASSKDFDLLRQSGNFNTGNGKLFSSEFSRDNIALYGEYTYALSPQLSLTTGARVERYDDSYTDSAGSVIDSDDTMWGGKLSLNYQLHEQALIYLQAARGYKAGGVNGEALAKAQDLPQAGLQDKASFKPEILYSAEFGVKGASADGMLVSRVAAFYMWRDDMQVKGWLNPNQGPEFAGFIDNAGSGRNYGIELENQIQLNPSLRLFVNAGWLKTRLGHYITANGEDFTGREAAHAPRFQYSVAADWYATDNVWLNLSVQGKDAFYYSDSHTARSKRYELVNLRLNYQLDAWQFSVWSRNALDKDIGVKGFYFGNDPRDGYEPHTYEQLAEPRRVGVTVSYQF